MTRSRTSILRTAILHLQVTHSKDITLPLMDDGDGPVKRRLFQQRFEPEQEIVGLHPRLISHLYTDFQHALTPVHPRTLLNDAAHLLGDTHLVQVPVPSDRGSLSRSGAMLWCSILLPFGEVGGASSTKECGNPHRTVRVST
jgi:hypothetical protein